MMKVILAFLLFLREKKLIFKFLILLEPVNRVKVKPLLVRGLVLYGMNLIELWLMESRKQNVKNIPNFIVVVVVRK